jgi:hypothetical protein
VPRLHSKVAANRWVFVYDDRRNVGYIVATTTRAGEETEMRFRVEWQPVEQAIVEK